MDLKNMINVITTPQEEKVHWGSAYSLWEVCRHKVIGLPVLDLLLKEAQDPQLKLAIEMGIESNAIPHIETLQNFMKEHNLSYPPTPPRGSIDDQQIGRAIKEIVRLALNHEIHAFMSTSRDNERELFWSILSDDRKTFDRIIDLCRKKGWLLNPPNLS